MSTQAEHRAGTAKAYVEASKMIYMSPHAGPNTAPTVMPMNMLVGFALELYFKSWLLSHGESSGKVQSYGHAIGKLYFDASLKGLPVIPRLSEIVSLLSAGHKDFTFRYSEPGDSVETLNWGPTFEVLDQLGDCVIAALPRSAP